MRHLLTFICLPLCLLAGCARMPSTIPPIQVPSRQLIVHFTLAAPLNPAYYYFIAVDTNGNPNDGPVPIVANPSAPVPATGVPIIISDSSLPPAFYVQNHQGAFFQFKDLVFSGPPYQAGVSTDGLTVAVAIDLSLVTTTATQIELNIITTDRLLPPTGDFLDLNYDGLGPSGNSYSIIPINVSGTYSNADAISPERAGDTAIGAIDITDWSVEVRLTQ